MTDAPQQAPTRRARRGLRPRGQCPACEQRGRHVTCEPRRERVVDAGVGEVARDPRRTVRTVPVGGYDVGGGAVHETQREITHGASVASGQRARGHLDEHPLGNELVEQPRRAQKERAALRMSEQEVVPAPR